MSGTRGRAAVPAPVPMDLLDKSGALRRSPGLGFPLWGAGCLCSEERVWGACLAEHLLLSAWDEMNEQSSNFCRPLNSLGIMYSQAKELVFVTIHKGIGGPSNSNVPLIIRALKRATEDKDMTSNTFSVSVRIEIMKQCKHSVCQGAEHRKSAKSGGNSN